MQTCGLAVGSPPAEGKLFPDRQRRSVAYFQVCGGNLSPDTNGAKILKCLNFAERQAEFAA